MKSAVPAYHPDSSLQCDFLRSPCKFSWMTTMHFSQSQSGLHWTVCFVSVPWSRVLYIHIYIYIYIYIHTLFDFCVTHIWELIPHIFEYITSFIHTSHEIFHGAQLYVQRGQINFLQKNKRKIDIFLPWHHRCSFRPQFIYIVIPLVPAVPLPHKTAVFFVPQLHSQ